MKKRADSLAGEHVKLSQEPRRALKALWLIRSFVGFGGPGVPGTGFFALVLYRDYSGHSFFARALASTCPLHHRLRCPFAPHKLAGASVVRHVDELTSRRGGAADGRALCVCFPMPRWVGGRFARPW